MIIEEMHCIINKVHKKNYKLHFRICSILYYYYRVTVRFPIGLDLKNRKILKNISIIWTNIEPVIFDQFNFN